MTAKKMLFVVLLALVLVASMFTVAVYAETSITIPTLNIDNFTLALVVIVAMLGALVAAFLGWLDSGETFDARKFSSSILHGIIGAFVFVLGYSFGTTVTAWDFLVIFLGSAGIDVIINRATGAIAQKPTIPTTTKDPPNAAATPPGGKQASTDQPETPAPPQPEQTKS